MQKERHKATTPFANGAYYSTPFLFGYRLIFIQIFTKGYT
jgi:hypothetical protein